MYKEAKTPIADLKGKRVLFIAYFFPPVDGGGLPAAMRIIKFLRNLDNGEMHVLTTNNKKNNQSALDHIQIPVNQERLHRVKEYDLFNYILRAQKWLKDRLKGAASSTPETELTKSVSSFKTENYQHKSRSEKLKDFIYNLFYFPDHAEPWILPAALAGKKIIRTHGIDVIFATGSPWSSLLVGYLISRWTGKPLIADFRDPWTNNPFHHSKGKLLDRWAMKLERKVVQQAAHVSLNTDALREDFLTRYPSIEPIKFSVLPNGFDTADFEVLDEIDPTFTFPFEKDANTLYLIHAGFLYGPRDPRVLLEAIRQANEYLDREKRRICFVQVGNTKLSYSINDEFSDLIEKGALKLLKGMPYKECIQLQKHADVLVNIQPGTKTQIPSKIYDYLALSKPIINITEKQSALEAMVLKYSFGELFGFHEASVLSEYLKSIAINNNKPVQFSGYPMANKYNVRNISRILARKIRETNNP